MNVAMVFDNCQCLWLIGVDGSTIKVLVCYLKDNCNNERGLGGLTYIMLEMIYTNYFVMCVGNLM